MSRSSPEGDRRRRKRHGAVINTERNTKMNRKLKAISLGMLAALAVSAFVVYSASAETGGKFDAAAGTTIEGTESRIGAGTGTHVTELSALGNNVRCTHASYHGTAAVLNPTSITITPTYSECYLNTHTAENATAITMNGCDYVFTVGKEPALKDQTIDLVCPAGAKAEVHARSGGSEICTETFGPQTVKGAVYTADTFKTKKSITLDLTVTGIVLEKHGACALLPPFGTNGTGELKGSVTVNGTNAAGEAVDIQATGP